MSTPRVSFEMRTFRTKLENILPVRKSDPAKVGRFQTISLSIKEVYEETDSIE